MTTAQPKNIHVTSIDIKNYCIRPMGLKQILRNFTTI
jgi:hypothetical protein